MIIGQFNIGFIVAFKPDNHEIYIIDQHSADEKYNFETLMQTTKIDSQKLLKFLLSLIMTYLIVLDH